MSDPDSTPQDPIWSHGEIDMAWRDDELFVGHLHIGYIWKDRDGKWHSWLCSSDNGTIAGNGTRIGLYSTEQEARDAMVDAAVRALLGKANG